MRSVSLSRCALLIVVLLRAPLAHGRVDCQYVGTGCNAGKSALASFECVSGSQLKITLTNTSSGDDTDDPSNNVLTSISFRGASPQPSFSDSALVAAGSSVPNAAYEDCAFVPNGPDVTCEWSAGSNYCASCATGVDPACPSPVSQCGLSFVSSRESSDVSCSRTTNFKLDPLGDIDGTGDGPDWGTVSATLSSGGVEAIQDTVEVTVDVGTCAETTLFCDGVATFGSHFRHATGTTVGTTTTTVPTTTTTSTTATTTSTSPTTTTTSSSSTTTVDSSTTTTTESTSTSTTTEPSTTSTSTTTTTTAASTTSTTRPPFCELTDHFKCYKALTRPRFQPRTVTLTDEFGSGSATILRPSHLCNPADKNGEGMIDPTAHLMCYKFVDTERTTREIVVRNQFGTQTMTVLGALRTLCQPAQKDMVPSFLNLDHYKCYKVRGRSRFVKREVALTDQFETKDTVVLRPWYVCNPVDKNDEGILDPVCRLTCYKVADAKGQPRFQRRSVVIEDQFGRQDRSVYDGECRQSQMLCVPSSPSAAFLDPR